MTSIDSNSTASQPCPDCPDPLKGLVLAISEDWRDGHTEDGRDRWVCEHGQIIREPRVAEVAEIQNNEARGQLWDYAKEEGSAGLVAYAASIGVRPPDGEADWELGMVATAERPWPEFAWFRRGTE